MTINWKIITLRIYYLLFPIGIYFLLHSIRNLFQYLGKDNILTRAGNHELGIKISNFLLSPFGLKYSASHEIYYFFLELFVSILLLSLFAYYLTKK